MLRVNSPVLQRTFQPSEIEVAAHRRQELNLKGQRLYHHYCGTQGSSNCVEGFIAYHLWRGEYAIVRDFHLFLQQQLASLQELAGRDKRLQVRLAWTEMLHSRIQPLLPPEFLRSL